MLTGVAPSPPLLTCALIALDCAGSVWMMSPTVARPAALRSSRFRIVTGAGVVSVLRSIVDPVTLMTSVLAAASESLASSSSLRFGLCAPEGEGDSPGAGATGGAAGGGVASEDGV